MTSGLSVALRLEGAGPESGARVKGRSQMIARDLFGLRLGEMCLRRFEAYANERFLVEQSRVELLAQLDNGRVFACAPPVADRGSDRRTAIGGDRLLHAGQSWAIANDGTRKPLVLEAFLWFPKRSPQLL